ncbi:MAG: hypothetical protein LUQ31_08475 [Methanoregula sp.]|jgi:sensor histidine kinase YesM|nr:hypothetical protein [Methanoregula sp.]
MDLPFISTEWFYFVILCLLVLVVVLLIVWMVRNYSSGTRRLELQIEQEKLEILKRDMAAKAHPFTRLSDAQVSSLRTLESENVSLETNNYAKELELEERVRKLENLVKGAKLDTMLRRIEGEERKVK